MEPAGGLTSRMSPPSVVVAVSPRLLSDAVRRTLDLDGIATSEASDGVGHVDIAIVTSGREPEVDAESVITLVSDEPGAAAAADVQVVDLNQLRTALAALLPRRPSSG